MDQAALDPVPTRVESDDVVTITVTVTYDVQIYAPFIGSITGNPIRLEAATSMRVE